jgi:DNA-directed RNA polymerase I subunit RPA43
MRDRPSAERAGPRRTEVSWELKNSRSPAFSSAMSQVLPAKRKHANVADAGVPSKKPRKDHREEKAGKKKDKGKGRASEADQEFKVINASLVVSIPPVFASNPRAGVEEMLDSMAMRCVCSARLGTSSRSSTYFRYIPAFQGVVLAHSNLQFLDPTATIKADCPFAVCKVVFDATVWSPQVGIKLGEFSPVNIQAYNSN